jgi:hypothetical protein
MQNRTITEARELSAFAAQFADALERGGERLFALPENEPEVGWLRVARARVLAARDGTEAALKGAIALPEFEAERHAARNATFGEWVDAVQALFTGISYHAGPNNPLIEVLFPDQKFDKLRRGGAHGRAYKAELEKRRAKAYVVRLSGEPEYDFMPPLLERLDQKSAELDAHDAPCTLSEAELDALRATVQAAADVLDQRLAQARLLAEAAFMDRPGLVAELGLDQKPRRRAPRATAGASVAPAAPAAPIAAPVEAPGAS